MKITIDLSERTYSRIFHSEIIPDDLNAKVARGILNGKIGEQPKTGHWIEGRTNDTKIHNILCSNCLEGYPSKGHARSQYTREKFKYCPNCGADMTGEVMMTDNEAREIINREIDEACDNELYMTDEVYDALCVASKALALRICSQPYKAESEEEQKAINELEKSTHIQTLNSVKDWLEQDIERRMIYEQRKADKEN